MFYIQPSSYSASQNYCCPAGATVINNSCGCDSSGSMKSYVASNEQFAETVFNIEIK